MYNTLLTRTKPAYFAESQTSIFWHEALKNLAIQEKKVEILAGQFFCDDKLKVHLK